MRWAMWLLLGSLLAGCSEPAEAPAPVPTTPGDPVMAPPQPMPTPPIPGTVAAVNQTFSQTDCDAVIFVHAVDFPEANAMLPLGYVAADLGHLLDVPTNLNRAAIGLIAYTCADDGLGAGPHAHAALAVFVDAPSIQRQQVGRPDVFLNIYERGRFISAPSQQEALDAIHWNTTLGLDLTIDVAVAEPLPDAGLDPRQPNPLTATSEGSLNGTRMWTGGASGATAYQLVDRPLRFWQDTPEGVSYQEFVVDRNGRGGISACVYDEGPVRDALGRGSCLQEDGLGLLFQDFNVTGRFVHLAGVHA